jgi:hypothetical protein
MSHYPSTDTGDRCTPTKVKEPACWLVKLERVGDEEFILEPKATATSSNKPHRFEIRLTVRAVDPAHDASDVQPSAAGQSITCDTIWLFRLQRLAVIILSARETVARAITSTVYRT